MTELKEIEFDGPRPARDEEMASLLDAVNFVHRTSRGKPPSVAADFPQVYDPANVGNVLVVASAGKVVASVGVWANEVELGDVRLKVGGINCLATLPEFRRHGLGRRLMQASHEHMRKLGCHVGILGTAIVNWYRKLGWEHAGVWRSYHLDRGNVGLLPPLPGGATMKAMPASEAAGPILRLRRKDKLGGARTPELFGRLCSSRPGREAFVAACGEGAAVAYLLAAGATAIEWGGDPSALAGLVRAWYSRLDDPAVSTSQRDSSFSPVSAQRATVAAPGGGHGFIEMLDRLRIPCSTGYAGMIYVVDPWGVLRAFGIKGVSIAEEADGFAVKRGKRSVKLGRNDFTKLLFGPERVSEIGEGIFPLPFCQWPLEHI